MTKTLVLISALPEDREFAAEVAQVAGLSLKTVNNPTDGAKLIADEGATIVMADTSSQKQYLLLEAALQEAVGLFSDKVNSNTFHFICSDEIGKSDFLVQSPIFGHFVLRHSAAPKEAGAHYGRIVAATLRERAFGLKELLGPTAKVQSVILQTSTQKQNAVEAVKNYLIAAKFQTRMATVVANAVDELLMNAIFDAPVDELGRQTYASTSRATVLQLKDKHAVEMWVGFDGQYAGISAIDHFGSLDKVRLLTHISKIYTEQEYKIKTSVAGAGIGLATVFRSGGSFFFISESHAKTEVTVFFKRTDSFREFKDQFRFISTQFYF